jgi:tetratricopeptide (TPR) repeat protein
VRVRSRRVALVTGLAIALFAAGGVGIWMRTQAAPSAVAAPVTGKGGASAEALRDHPVLAADSLAQTIAALQSRITAIPRDWNAMASLGIAYVQQARVTADPTYYPKAEAILRRSLAVHPGANFDAMVGMAALAAARHDFAGALSWGQQAEAANPYNGGVHDVVGDALIELGSYPQAFAEIQKAVDTRPDLSSYARASYALELQGDNASAVRAMKLALSAAGTAADTAWTENQLGELAFNAGDLAGAEAAYRRAIAADPSFVPPHAGMAKVAAARGDLAGAIAGYEWVVTRYPLPEYVIALGDLDTKAGLMQDAARDYGLLRVEERLFQANGVNVDLEIALFDADHRVDLAVGLAAAQAEWGRRQSIHVADTLAWELYANGRASEALAYANRALALGTRSALFFFHRGMIERALGRTLAARRDLATALAINPSFSILWSKPAASILACIGGAP